MKAFRNRVRVFAASALVAPFLSAPQGVFAARPAPAPPLVPAIVSSSPDGASLSVDGVSRGTTPLQIRLAPGRHVARLEAAGVAPTFVAFTTGEAPSEAFFELPRPAVSVLVESDPPGAAITLDGASVGTSPVLLPAVEPGRREFSFSLPGYKPQRIEAALAAPGPAKVTADLAPTTATVFVDSDPRGAAVSVNGSPRGVTPLEVPGIPESGAVVELSSPGHAPWRAETGPLPSGSLYRMEASLEPLPCVVRVVSLPSDARIYVDEVFAGRTPLSVTNPVVGPHTLRAERDGHETVARTVELGRGSNPTQEFRLRPTGGDLRLSTTPPGVSVSVDGHVFGKTAGLDDATASDVFVVSNLAAGVHSVRLSRPGWEPKTAEFEIGEGRPADLGAVTLIRKFIPDYLIETRTTGIVRGRFVENTADAIRIETAPGIVRSIPKSHVVRVANIEGARSEPDR